MENGKGWYRYRLLLGSKPKQPYYEVEIVIQKRYNDHLVDFSKEDAEESLRVFGKYLNERSDFKNLKEDF